jgi:hypothetical protein
MHSMTEKPEAQTPPEQKNPGQSTYDNHYPMMTKKSGTSNATTPVEFRPKHI